MIVFIIIIYRIKLHDCIALSSLLNSLGTNINQQFEVLVFDNSENSSEVEEHSSNFKYIKFGRNVGLSHAYNYGVEYCKKNNAEFMVTLDQDSTVTSDYVNAVFNYANLYAGRDVVLCPRVMVGDRQVSPYSFNLIGAPRYTCKGKLHAINSFTVYAVHTLATYGIIDEFYWLDALDFSIFAKLHRYNIQVVAMDVIVQHDLSLLHGALKHSRLSNIAFYEAVFLFEYCGPVRAISGLLRLIVRILRRIDYKNRFNDLGLMLGKIVTGSSKGLIRRIRRGSWKRCQISI